MHRSTKQRLQNWCYSTYSIFYLLFCDSFNEFLLLWPVQCWRVLLSLENTVPKIVLSFYTYIVISIVSKLGRSFSFNMLKMTFLRKWNLRSFIRDVTRSDSKISSSAVTFLLQCQSFSQHLSTFKLLTNDFLFTERFSHLEIPRLIKRSIVASGGFRVGGPDSKKGGPLMTSSCSANRDNNFWSSLRCGHSRIRSWDYGITDVAEGENAKACLWYTTLKTLKVGKTWLATQKLGNSKLALPPLLYFRAPFLCIHHQSTTKLTPLKVSHFPLWKNAW